MQFLSRRSYATLALLLLGTASAHAGVGVYVTSSGNATADADLVAMLTGFGHTVTLGVPYNALDGTQSLAGINTVYFQPNYNWTSGDMPLAGQNALVNFVTSGGGLVTSEWLVWNIAASGETQFTAINPLLPVAMTAAFDSAGTGNFSVNTPDAVLNAGLPAAFSTPLESISGTQTHFTTLRPGAVSYYVNNAFIGLAGVTAGSGRVLSFNTVNAQLQVADPNFGRLLSNSMDWAAGNASVSTAPEPGTLALLALGGTLLAGARIRRRRSA